MGQGNTEKSLPSLGVDVIGPVTTRKRNPPSSGLSLMSQVDARKNPSPSSGVVVLGFVFAGGCGTNNARRFMASTTPEEYPYLFVLVANTDGPQLKQFFDPAAANHDLNDNRSEERRVGKECRSRW